MKIVTVVGVILAVLGAAALIYGGITFASGTSAVDVGAMHLDATQKEKIPLFPLAGALAMATGVALTVVGQSLSTRGDVPEV